MKKILFSVIIFFCSFFCFSLEVKTSKIFGGYNKQNFSTSTVRDLFYTTDNILLVKGYYFDSYRYFIIDCKNNRYLCITGVGANKDFCALMTDSVIESQFLSNCQCFPLLWRKTNNELTLFEETDNYSITSYALNEVRKKYSRNDITHEDIFYYIYGLFHSKDYKKSFSADLKKGLPRIPFVNSYDTFELFSKAGRKLSDLHVNYEKIKPYDKCNITAFVNANYSVTKMRFTHSNDKSSIDFNDRITISNIPLKAYEYIVNNKSAIEWLMDKYSINIDKKSDIKNDPNDWCKEVDDEKYIFNLLLKIINVSVQTVEIVDSLPTLDFE